MSGKYALIIGNTEYADPGLAELSSPGRDTEDFARVLKDREIGAFDDVNILLNQPEPVVRGAIDEFFDQKKPDDLLVLYFSGHGVRDELGALFLAVKNTIRSRLRSTAVKSDYIREVMDQSRSRRQVLILDCCNSGAFSQGTKAATGVSIGTSSAFESGFGRIILTASDSTQFAWEGDKVIGETDNSLFTHYLVEGLEGEADLDGDGRITVDELYDYAYEKVKHATPKQTPSKFSSKQQGEIILRQNMPMDEIKSVPLPTPLLDSIENPFSDVRMGAVQQLIKLLKGKNLGLARSAREALERIAEEDDSRQVQRAAAQALESVKEAKQQPIVKQEAEARVGASSSKKRTTFKSKEKEVAKSRKLPSVISEQIESPEKFEWGYVLWIALGWILGGAICGAMYWDLGDDGVQWFILSGLLGGIVGGFSTALTLQFAHVLSTRKDIFIVSLGWALGGTSGWFIGDLITEISGAAIGGVIIGAIGLITTANVVRGNFARADRILTTLLSWVLGNAIGWQIGRVYLFGSIDGIASWAIGTGVGWGIPGIVLGWQLLRDKNTSGGKAEDFSLANQETRSLINTYISFLLLWKGRMLLGGIFGIILGIAHHNIIDFFIVNIPLTLIVAGSLAGLAAYPHIVSFALMVTGFFVVGYFANPVYYEVFIAWGGTVGILAGALISRILYWLKLIK